MQEMWLTTTLREHRAALVLQSMHFESYITYSAGLALYSCPSLDTSSRNPAYGTPVLFFESPVMVTGCFFSAQSVSAKLRRYDRVIVILLVFSKGFVEIWKKKPLACIWFVWHQLEDYIENVALNLL